MARPFNCCVFNHPCPIFCPLLTRCNGNTIVNPTITEAFGFFNNTDVGTIGSQFRIPLNLVQGNSDRITASTTNGAVQLTPGTYEVTYLAGGSVPANGTLSIKLRLNGFDVTGSTLNGTQTAGNVVNLTQSIVLTVTQTSVLELVNNSAQTANFAYASMVVKSL